MNSTSSNIDVKSDQTFIDNLIQKVEMFNRNAPQGFDLLYISSSNKSILVVDVDTPAKKNINITSFRTLTNLGKSKPQFDITETHALKDNSSFKLASDIFKKCTKIF